MNNKVNTVGACRHSANSSARLLSVMLLALFFWAEAMPQTVFTHPWQGKRVAYFGDSITDPRNKAAKKKYWTFLQARLSLCLATSSLRKTLKPTALR